MCCTCTGNYSCNKCSNFKWKLSNAYRSFSTANLRQSYICELPILHVPRLVTLTQSHPFISILKQIIVTFNMVDHLTFIYTLGYSKSADLTSLNTESDTPILIEAKERIREQIIAWS